MFDAHGVEMNQRYASGAVLTDGQPEPAFEQDAELHYQPTTWPGARLPHVWLLESRSGARVSTLDLCGRGRFTLLTRIGGEGWRDDTAAAAKEMGVDLAVHLIGSRQTYVDHGGDWGRAGEIADAVCLLVRPDYHVAWRAADLTADPPAESIRALRVWPH